MRKAVCSGSFDPVTIGHIDIIERASRMFDEIIVCVFYNPGKATSLFTPKERVEMLKAATSHLPNVRVTSCSGLLNEFCEKEKASFIVRGLRAFTDANYSYISSSGVRELLAFGGDIGQLVPAGVEELIRKYQKRKTK